MKGVIRGVATVMMIWISKIGRGVWGTPKVPRGGGERTTPKAPIDITRAT